VNLRRWRRWRELEQAEVARRVGVGRTYLSAVERGRARLARVLEVGTEELSSARTRRPAAR
jgi:transcriptional regulator with XRE-family HTH domain